MATELNNCSISGYTVMLRDKRNDVHACVKMLKITCIYIYIEASHLYRHQQTHNSHNSNKDKVNTHPLTIISLAVSDVLNVFAVVVTLDRFKFIDPRAANKINKSYKCIQRTETNKSF